MSQMEACERGAPCEEEPALALKERVEDVALERGQFARRGGGHGGASLRSENSRTRTGVRPGGEAAPARARPRRGVRTPRRRYREPRGASWRAADRAADRQALLAPGEARRS